MTRSNISLFRFSTVFSVCLVCILLVSCGTSKTLKLLSQAEVLADAGNTQDALEVYESVISDFKGKGKAVPDSLYVRAGWLAYTNSLHHKAIGFFEKVSMSGVVDCNTMLYLSKSYRAIDNLSKEISTLEQIAGNCDGFDSLFSVQTRLMHTYLESQNYDKALSLWAEIPDKKESSEPLMTDYLEVLRVTGNKSEALEAVKKLLKINPANTSGLFYMGSSYYHQAESKYQAEMEAYNANKTQRRYLYLVEQLKLITKDYQTAKFYFETLYKYEPNNRNAEYLANIFARLNNESKSQYYRGLIK